MSRRPACFAALFVVEILAASAGARAQTNPNLEEGLKPYGSYHGGNVDVVSVSNGNLFVQSPFYSTPQRGAVRLSYVLQFNNKGWYLKTVCPPLQECYQVWMWKGATRGGVRVVDDQQHTLQVDYIKINQSQTIQAHSAVGPDDSTHQMAQLTTGSVYRSLDVTGFRYNGTIIDRTGIRYYQDAGSVRREDPNGNQILTTVDTLGRTPITSSSTTDYSNCTGPLPIYSALLWTVAAPGGGNTTIKICKAQVHIQRDGTETGEILGFSADIPLTQSIVLPNLTAWTFEYNSDGDLTRITFPTGGTLSYTYTTTWMCVNSGQTYSTSVATRTLDANDGTGPHTWTYTWGTEIPGPTRTNVVTDPMGNDTVHTMTGLGGTCSYYETQTHWFEGPRTTGTLLRTESKVYTWSMSPFNQFFPPGDAKVVNVVPIWTTTTWPNGKVSKAESDYDAGFTYKDPNPNSVQTYTATYGNVVTKREYDYGSGTAGTLLRRTVSSYLALGNSNYEVNNLLDRLSSVTFYDGAGTQIAQSSYSYDQTSLVASGITTSHNLSPINGTYRGNQTTVSRWRNTDGANLTTATKYFDTGTVQQVTDPANHSTTYTYSSVFAGAYPTSITNALNQSSSANYDFNSGLVTSRTDLNSQTTNYAYDNMARVTQITYPVGGGQTTFCYTDSGGATCAQAPTPFKVLSTKQISAALNHVSTAVVDGLGLLTQTQLASDPEGATSVDTTYDAAGRKATVSNPHRAGSLPTDGITTFKYDALGRICVLVSPDGTSVPGNDCPSTAPPNDLFTAYSGNCTTVTDQAGKLRKSCTDALGRLIQVFEPNASGSLVNETAYQYDTLDNLTRVDQKGNDPNSANWRTRTFTYNSLSQLLTATNPESGAISYTYDNDGNLLTKVAPAPNQTGSATVTTTFSYDALHRLTQKSFSDATPIVKYGYDEVAPSGCTLPTLTITNGIGRRTGMCDAAGAEAWSYDSMGRPLIDKRTTNSVTKTTSYTYNLDGSVATLTYPSGRMITYTPNAAGRTVSAVDTANSINYATAASYAPTGALSFVQNGSGLYSTFLFNSRLQPCWIYVHTASAGAPTTCTQTGVATAGVLDFQYDFGLGTADNGNVNRITNRRNSGRSTTYQYDELNRIKSAITDATAGQFCWGQLLGEMVSGNYVSGYDIWGNLKKITPDPSRPGCGVNTLALTISNANKVVDPGYAYDSAGNMTAEPGTSATYQYDAENRLKSASSTLGSSAYLYDGDGKRVAKAPISQPTQPNKIYWYGLGSDPLTETDSAGTPAAEFVFFNGKRTARLDLPSAVVHYYFSDHLGSASVVTSSTGAIQDESDYYPFGGERVIADTDSNPYKFTGKERDAESGLDNFKARYFGSSMGRFSSPDPLMIMRQKLTDPQQWNMYTYVRNNPLRFLDPTGMYICGGTEKECASFEKARQNALKSKDKDTVRAAKAYGDPGKDNGVNVGFAKDLKGDRGGQVTRRGGGIEGDPNSPNGLRATLNVTIKSDLAGDEETIAHEGSHVADNQDFVNAITPGGKIDQSLNITLRASEIRAYLVSIGYAQRGNKTLNFGPCGVMGECKFPPGMMPALRDQRINDLLNSQYDSKMLDRLLYPELKP